MLRSEFNGFAMMVHAMALRMWPADGPIGFLRHPWQFDACHAELKAMFEVWSSTHPTVHINPSIGR